jgi:hypothetical protein
MSLEEVVRHITLSLPVCFVCLGSTDDVPTLANHVLLLHACAALRLDLSLLRCLARVDLCCFPEGHVPMHV